MLTAHTSRKTPPALRRYSCALLLMLVILASPAQSHAQPSATPNTNVYVTNGTVFAIAQSGNIVYIGGNFTMVGPNGGLINIARTNLAAMNAYTGEFTDWNPNLNGIVNALAVSADGNTVYAGGQFTTVNGATARNRIAAFDSGTGLATTWNPNASSTVEALGVSGATVYVGGSFTTIGGQTRNRIAAIDSTTGLATAWDPDASSTVKALLVDGATVYAGGSFTTVNGGTGRNRIASFSAATGTAGAWDPDANNTVESLAISSDSNTVYAGGWFTSIGGQARNYIAALDAGTAAATAWNPNANLIVNAVAVSPDDLTIYAGGFFTSIGAQTRNNIAALDAGTAAAAAWNPNANSFVEALVVSSTTVMAGGWFTTVGGGAQAYFAYFGDLQNGPPDTPTSLGPAAYVDGSGGTEKSPQVTFSQSDPNTSDNLAYRVQIDNDSNFSSPVVDYTSTVLAQGATSFTVGQAVGTGSYAVGASGQELAVGSYYWRVRSNDGSLDGNWATANGGAAAFVVTEPTVDFSAFSYAGGEANGAIVFTVTLSSSSVETVSVDYASSNGSATAGSDYTAVAGTSIFSPGQTGKNFTVIPMVDDIDEDNETVTLTLTNSTNAALIGGNNPAGLVIIDDDTSGVTVAETDGSTTASENGAGDTYTVVLDSEPTEDVVIAVTPDGQIDVGGGSGVPSDLTFTSANWNTPRTVAVTADNDELSEGTHVSTVAHSATSDDTRYDGIAIADVSVTISDDDSTGVTIAESNGSTDLISSDSVDTYTVVLNSQPTSDVTMTVAPRENCDVGLGAGESLVLTFTSSDWNTAQTVSVSSEEAGISIVPDTCIISHSAISSDGNFDGIAVRDVIVTINADGSASPGGPNEDSITILDFNILVSVSSTVISVGEAVQFRARVEETDGAMSDAPPFEFLWDFDAEDGIQEQADGGEATWVYNRAGLYRITLTVQADDSAVIGSTEVEITVVKGGSVGSEISSRPPAPADYRGTSDLCNVCGIKCGVACSLELYLMFIGLMGLRLSWRPITPMGRLADRCNNHGEVQRSRD